MKKHIQQLKNLIQKVLTRLMFGRYLKGLDSGSLVIDCGANVGDITTKLAATGAVVHAFEPNPFAFEVLKKRVGDKPKVHLHPKGVWDKHTRTKLYFHEGTSSGDEAFWAFGSSILAEKGNVLKGKSVEVEIIDLTEFIEGLDRPVDLLKIDIEGAECELLEKFIAKGLHQKVKQTLVETHDSKIPGQKVKTDKVRALIRDQGIRNINLNWL